MGDSPEQRKSASSGELANRRTTEGMRRLVAFCDAVVAIALTLLVLPLTDAAGDAEHISAWRFLGDHSGLVMSVLISFGVIAGFWWHHHQMIEYFEKYDGTVVLLHLLWLLTIVLLPFSTELGSGRDVADSNVLYLVILAVSATSLSAIAAWARRHPDLLVDGDERADFLKVRFGWITVCVMLVALAVSSAFPGSGSWPLLLLFAIGPAERMVNGR